MKKSCTFLLPVLLLPLLLGSCITPTNGYRLNKYNVRGFECQLVPLNQYPETADFGVLPGNYYLIRLTAVTEYQSIHDINLEEVIIESPNNSIAEIWRDNRTCIIRTTEDARTLKDINTLEIRIEYNGQSTIVEENYSYPINWEPYTFLDFSGNDGYNGRDGFVKTEEKVLSPQYIRQEVVDYQISGEDGGNGSSGPDMTFQLQWVEGNDSSPSYLLLKEKASGRIYLFRNWPVVIDCSGGDGGNGGRGLESVKVEGETYGPGPGGTAGTGGNGGNVTIEYSEDIDINKYIRIVSRGGESGNPGRNGDRASLTSRNSQPSKAEDGEILYNPVPEDLLISLDYLTDDENASPDRIETGQSEHIFLTFKSSETGKSNSKNGLDFLGIAVEKQYPMDILYLSDRGEIFRNPADWHLTSFSSNNTCSLQEIYRQQNLVTTDDHLDAMYQPADLTLLARNGNHVVQDRQFWPFYWQNTQITGTRISTETIFGFIVDTVVDLGRLTASEDEEINGNDGRNGKDTAETTVTAFYYREPGKETFLVAYVHEQNKWICSQNVPVIIDTSGEDGTDGTDGENGGRGGHGGNGGDGGDIILYVPAELNTDMAFRFLVSGGSGGRAGNGEPDGIDGAYGTDGRVTIIPVSSIQGLVSRVSDPRINREYIRMDPFPEQHRDRNDRSERKYK